MGEVYLRPFVGNLVNQAIKISVTKFLQSM